MKLLDLLFKLTLWFLLTADTSIANIAIGFCVALLLPQFRSRPVSARSQSKTEVLQAWLQMLWKIAIAIPRAYFEAFEMILHPHTAEEITVIQGEARPTRGLVFLDIFWITFTPKTIVVNYSSDGQYVVHSVSKGEL